MLQAGITATLKAYFERSCFRISARTRLSWLRYFLFFLTPPGICWDSTCLPSVWFLFRHSSVILPLGAVKSEILTAMRFRETLPENFGLGNLLAVHPLKEHTDFWDNLCGCMLRCHFCIVIFRSHTFCCWIWRLIYYVRNINANNNTWSFWKYCFNIDNAVLSI
jgi:hypothetical protein